MTQYFGTGQIINGNHIDAGHIEDLAIDQAADATEPIDSDFDSTHTA
jgi:hypothetical protein